MITIVLRSLYIFIYALLQLYIVEHFDKEAGIYTKDKYVPLLVTSILVGIALSLSEADTNYGITLYQSIFFAYILVCAYIDYQTKKVYDFMHVLPAMLGIAYCLQSHTEHNLVELAIFIGLQLFLFSRMYGFGDCLVFSVCAIYITVFQGELMEYLYLMSITFIVLALVQWKRRNINRQGNLKEAVALVPYIGAAMVWMGIVL
ncbi:MAG: hypothetical protein R3Y47_09630 [Lachnospiraceae bacterium]